MQNVTRQDSNGNILGSYTTIQEAIDAASAGETIVVSAGTYAENLNITKSLTIEAANLVQDGGATSTLQGTSSANLFTLGADATNVTIRGFAITGDTMFGGAAPDQTITFDHNNFDVTATHANVFYGGYQAGYHFTFTGNNVDVAGYTEFFDLFEGGAINVSNNHFTGHAGTYQAGADNNVPLIVNANGASGQVNGNVFTGVDIGVLIAGKSGLLSVGDNTFSGLHRVDGATAGGKAAGIVFFAADYHDLVAITGNQFFDSDAGIRTSGVPGTTLENQPIVAADNSFSNVGSPVLLTIPGELATTNTTIDGTTLPSAIYGGTGNETLSGTAAADTIDGGAGVDTVTYDHAVTVGHGANGFTVDDGTSTDTLHNVEVVTNGATGTHTLLVGDGGFATIQAAVDAANDGDTIVVAGGTYTEQVKVSGFEGLTIRAAAGETVTVVAPSDVVGSGIASSSGRPISAVVAVSGSHDVVLDGLTIDGAGAGNTVDGSNAQFVGVAYRNASGALEDVNVTGVHDAYPGGTTVGGEPVQSGNQRGVGVIVDNDAPAAGDALLAFAMHGGTIDDFQKNGMSILHADVDISDVTVIGGGAQTIIAQNGIQVGYSTGSIDGNHISDIGYAGPQMVDATGMLTYGNTDLDITNNHVTGADVDTAAAQEYGIYIDGSSGGAITGNTVDHVDYGLIVEGDITSDAPTINTNTVTALDPAAQGAGLYFAPTETLTTDYVVAGTIQGDYIAGAAGNDRFNGGAGDDYLDGGDGTDTASYDGTATITHDANNGWQVTQSNGVDTLVNVEVVDDDAAGRTLLVGDGGYATIQDAVDAANDGDTIRLADGDFRGDVTVDKHVAIVGANAGVAGDGTRGAESTISGAVIVTADGVSFDGVRFSGSELFSGEAFATGVSVRGNDLSITNSVFDGAGDSAVLTHQVTGLDIGASKFAGYDIGIYVSGGGSTGSIHDNLFQGAGGAQTGLGNGVNSETSGVTIDHNHFDGLYAGVVNLFPFGPDPVDVSSYLLANNSFINNAAERPVQIYPTADSTHLTGTDFNEAFNGDLSGVTGSLSFDGMGGNDHIYGASASDTLTGGSGDDLLMGNGGNDTLAGGGGTDTAEYAGNVADATITGTMAGGRYTSFTGVSTATDGSDTLSGIEKLAFADATLNVDDPVQLFDGANHLVGTFATIQAALDASADGYTLRVAAGEYVGDLTVNHAITIDGANAGTAGSATRGAETVIVGTTTVNAAATLDGVRVEDRTANSTYFEGVRVHGAGDVTVTNSVFYSTGVNGDNNVGVGGDRALYLDTTATGHVTFSDNLVTGLSTGGYGTASWSRGVWSDGATSQLDVTGNTFQYVRSGLNLDSYNDAKVNVSGNHFVAGGTGIAIGIPATNTITGIHDNQFTNVGDEINLQNISTGQNLNLTDTHNSADGVATNLFVVLGSQAGDSLVGSAGADELHGNGGNDTIAGGAGNDTLLGDAGTDTAVFSGNRAQYTFASSNGSVTVTDTVADRDGTDTLTGIESVKFADRTQTLDSLVNNTAPTDIALTGQSVSENAANGTVVGTASATDANVAGGDSVTYSLSNDVGGRFTIDAATGVVSVADGSRLDAESAQSHAITIVATDSGGLTYSEVFTINVGDVNEFAVTTPTDTNAAANTVAENVAVGTAVGITAHSTDADATTNAVTYSLSNNAGGLFAIDATTGVVTTAAAIDFESTGPSKSITVVATSADGSTAAQNLTVAITNVNEAPAITSNGGGATAAISVLEDTVAVTTVQASDVDAGTTLSYAISGGADAAKFSINAMTGVLTFKAAPDFEHPTDAGANNVYDVIVSASDGALVDTQAIAVSVLDNHETQTIVLTNRDDTYTATSDDNYVVEGLQGNDKITTRGGRDVVRGDAGNDTISTGANDDVITYFGNNNGGDTVDGGAGDDRINALADDTVIGLAKVTNVETISANGYANVSILGGSGNDSLDFRTVTLTDIVKIDAGQGNDTVHGSQGDDVISSSKGNDQLFGEGGNDVFLIEASAGTDTFNGGAGTDTIRAAVDNVSLGWGSVTGVEAIDADGHSGFVIAGTSAADTIDLTGITLTGVAAIDGGNGNDTIIGSAGADTIIGNAGNDILKGGAGNDVFLFNAASSQDTIDGGADYDTLRATGSNAVVIWGNLTNVEAIDGAGFANVSIGGTNGNDTIDLTGYTLTGISAIDGGAGNDRIIGSGQADTILGGAGTDNLSGAGGDDNFVFTTGSGADTIDGGSGTDTLIAGATGASLTWGSFTNVEVISAGTFAGVQIVGGTTADNIDLRGYTLVGIEAIDGGKGDDTIHGSNQGDTIIGNAGNDHLFGEGGDDVFVIGTNQGNDTIDGGAGSDTIRAAAANAQITLGNWTSIENIDAGGFTGVRIVGTTSNNVLDLSSYHLTGIEAIDAGKGNDTVIGSADADTIIGNQGSDRLTGGGGADTFVYTLLTDSTNTVYDTITDFTQGVDKIDLSLLDAVSGATGDQAFTFIGNAAFHHVAGELRFDQDVNGVTRITGDVNGDGVADFQIRLTDPTHATVLTSADFML